MNERKCPVLGIILGDHAGIGPEIAAMDLAARGKMNFAVVLVGSLPLFRRAMALVPGSEGLNIVDIAKDPRAEKAPGSICFVDIPVSGEIPFGQVNAASGELIYRSMMAMIALEKQGAVDGFVMGPITKQALHAAGLSISSEFDIFSAAYRRAGVRAVVKAGNIFRCTAVGHVRFRDIASKLTVEGVCETARCLAGVMERFMPGEGIRIAVAALNPHAGEGGLFGDEEQTILEPAIRQLRQEGLDVIGPCPADTVYRRAQIGEVGGIVFLYHDQGNIAMKAASFGDGVLIYTNVPARIVSVGHGSAFDSAGKGTASPANFTASVNALLEMITEDI